MYAKSLLPARHCAFGYLILTINLNTLFSILQPSQLALENYTQFPRSHISRESASGFEPNYALSPAIRSPCTHCYVILHRLCFPERGVTLLDFRELRECGICKCWTVHTQIITQTHARKILHHTLSVVHSRDTYW
jgi:hypothetical protein